MSNWTDADTEALAAVAGDVERHCDFPDVGEDALLTRAADEIERLRARVAELEAERELRTQRFDALREADAAEVMRLEADNEALQSHVAMRTEILAMAERADTIPRAVLVRALRDRAKGCPDQDWPESTRDELEQVADEIERGEWPKAKEGT